MRINDAGNTAWPAICNTPCLQRKKRQKTTAKSAQQKVTAAADNDDNDDKDYYCLVGLCAEKYFHPPTETLFSVDCVRAGARSMH